MLTLYGLKNCSSCKKARAWLEQNAVEYQFIDYRDQPLATADLRRYARTLGWPKLVNRASMTWRKLPEAAKSQATDAATDATWLALVEEFPTLIRRPLAVDGKQVRVGFKPDQYQSWLVAAD